MSGTRTVRCLSQFTVHPIYMMTMCPYLRHSTIGEMTKGDCSANTMGIPKTSDQARQSKSGLSKLWDLTSSRICSLSDMLVSTLYNARPSAAEASCLRSLMTFFDSKTSQVHSVSHSMRNITPSLSSPHRILCLSKNLLLRAGARWNNIRHHFPLPIPPSAELLLRLGILVGRWWCQFEQSSGPTASIASPPPTSEIHPSCFFHTRPALAVPRPQS